MAQYARPASDASLGDWSPPPLHEKVGGSTPDDPNPITAFGTNPCVLTLSPITAPQAGTVRLRVRVLGNDAYPDAALVVELLSEGVPVAMRTLTNLPLAFTTLAIELDTSERNAITDWAALAVRLTATTAPATAVTFGGIIVTFDGEVVTYADSAPM